MQRHDARRHPRILIVDDESDFRLVVGTMLVDRGCAIDEAASGEEAIARLRGASFDAVLLDNVMPGKTGAEVAAELAGVPDAPAVVLFATSLSADVERQARALGVRAVDKLDLIVELDRILEAVAARSKRRES